MILGLAVQGNKCGTFGSTVIGGHDVSSTLGSTISCVVLGKHCGRSSVAVRAVGVLSNPSR